MAWFFPPPGGAPQGVAAGEHFWPRWSCWIGHSHVYAPQPSPGAPAMAFEALGLSEFSPIGPATINRMQLRHLETTAFAGPGYLTQGLGGLVRGQFVATPLTVAGNTPSVELDYTSLLPPENWIG